MCLCYNITDATTVTKAQLTGRKCASKVPKVPPTAEIFEENVKTAQCQCVIWKNALHKPSHLDPTKFIWSRNENTKSLESVMLPPATNQLWIIFLNLYVCCSCASCAYSKCGCVAANLAFVTAKAVQFVKMSKQRKLMMMIIIIMMGLAFCLFFFLISILMSIFQICSLFNN